MICSICVRKHQALTFHDVVVVPVLVADIHQRVILGSITNVDATNVVSIVFKTTALAPGMLSRYKAEEGRKLACCGKPFEVSNLHNKRQRRVNLDSFEANQHIHPLPVLVLLGEFADPLVKPFHLVSKLLIGDKVLFKSLL